MPPGLRDELQARGYLSIAAPEEYGGRGIPFSRWLELLELFSMSHASLRMIVHVANGVWRAVDQFATPEQRERFVLPAVNGDGVVAFTLTEPTAGTGADLRCSVAPRGRHLPPQRREAPHHLRPHAATAGCCSRAWRARRAATAPSRSWSTATRPNVQAVDMGESLGVRGTDHAHLVFDGTPVPVENRLGEEGRGLEVAFGGFLTPSRIAVGMTCVGLARKAQELAVEHARERVTFGKPLAARQAIAFSLAENAADIEAARQLVLHAARASGRRARPTPPCCPRWRS